MTIRLTTRGIRTAEAIRDRVPFTTSGSLKGEAYSGYVTRGKLNDADREVLAHDRETLDYIVFSYATPIAWHRNDGTGWHIVSQRFTPTTGKHQGNLYLVDCTCTTVHDQGFRVVGGGNDPLCPVHKAYSPSEVNA